VMQLQMQVTQTNADAKFWMLCRICWCLRLVMMQAVLESACFCCDFFSQNETFILKVSFEMLDLQ